MKKIAEKNIGLGKSSLEDILLWAQEKYQKINDPTLELDLSVALWASIVVCNDIFI